MSSLEKLKILTPLQKLPKNVGYLGKLIVAQGFKKLPKVQKTPNLVTLVASVNCRHRILDFGPSLGNFININFSSFDF